MFSVFLLVINGFLAQKNIAAPFVFVNVYVR